MRTRAADVQQRHSSDESQQHVPASPLGTEEGDDAADRIKIMLATDNHIGYMERDPVRGQDSIRTFEEILKLAVEHDVDLILLGGDLFHENKPSRSTLHQTMALLRQYTLGDKPVSIELLSDPNDGALPGQHFPAINYDDPNLNVSIPVFSIHGNHDDPQGTGETGALSALDLLSVSGLINYFGKVELPSDDAVAANAATSTARGGAFAEKGIRIKPVLLQKGATRLALYGMGNIKDERMHFELRANRVRMYRPEEEPESWFNILCVHQNRVAHNPKACVPETMFDDSVHLVVWGHEHEQRIQPQPVTEKRYHITQPGSSVATSLSQGETVDKCVAIVHVHGTDFRMEPILLQTVRPFVMDDISLTDALQQANLTSERGNIMKLLRQRVNALIAKARTQYAEQHPDHDLAQMPLPLIRLRVEYTNQEISNPQRFGQEFAGKVANPKDVLQFSKKKAMRAAAAGAAHDGSALSSAYVDIAHDDDDTDLLPAEKLDNVDVGKLVQEYLQAQNLDILNAEGLEGAVLNFVEKDDKDAIDSFVTKMLRHTVQGLITIDPEESRIDNELERLRQDQHRRRQDTQTGARGGRGSRRSAESDDSMMDDMSADEAQYDAPEATPPAPLSRRRAPVSARTRATPAKPAATPRRKQPPPPTAAARSTATFLGQDDDDDFSDHQSVHISDEDDDDDEFVEAPPRAPPARTSRRHR